MKNIKAKAVALSMAALLLLSGCGVKENLGMEVTKDKKVKVSITMAYDEEFIDMSLSDDMSSEETFSSKERWNYLEEHILDDADFDYEDYEKFEDDDYMGYTFILGEYDLDDVTGTKKDDAFNIFGEDALEDMEDAPLFILKDGVYKSNMVAEFDGEDYESIDEYSEYLDVEITYSITLPTKPLKDNADDVSKDGLTLTWDLSDLKDTDIKFEFKMPSSILPIILGVVAAIIIIGVVVAVVLILLKKKPEKIDAPVSETKPEVKIPETPAPEVKAEEPAVAVAEPVEEKTEEVEAVEAVEEKAEEAEAEAEVAEEAEPVVEEKAEESAEEKTEEAADDTKTCPSCGAKLSANAKFCGSCGASLEEKKDEEIEMVAPIINPSEENS